MDEQKVLQSQRNDVLLAIQAAGFDPAAFSWERIQSPVTTQQVVSRLVHQPSGGFYIFDLLNGNHACRYSPADQTSTGDQYPGDWRTQLHYFQNWLGFLCREVDAPDLWAGVTAEGQLARGATGALIDANAPFTAREHERIIASIGEIRRYLLSTHSIDQARLDFAEERLRYLEEASGRLGRKDWLNLAFGAVINIIVGAALAPDAARDVMRVVGAALAWVFGGSTLLPGAAQ